MEMTFESLPDDVTKINLVGRLDIKGAQDIDLHFSVVVGSHRKVIVDMTEVPFLASMGLRTLLMGARSMKPKGGRMALLTPTADVEKVLLSSGADTIIPIVHDLASAIGVVSGQA